MENKVSRMHGSLTYRERKARIRGSMQNMANEYIEIGYHLRAVQAGEEYQEDGYGSIHEFALEEFGMGKATVNHCMRVNAEFSEGGGSPKIAEKYRGFSKSQLQEMLYIPDELREDVKPDMSIRKIRQIKEKRLDVEPGQEEEGHQEKKPKPYGRGCITGWSRYPDYCACCGHEGAECCSQCEKSCNGRCGWVNDPYVREEEIPGQMHVEDYPELMPEEPAADPECREKDGAQGQEAEKWEDLSELSDIELLQGKLEKEKRTLDMMLEEFTEKDRRVRLQKLIVGALAANICGMDNQQEPPEPVQPEFPVLKNNDQRKEWLRDYKAWGLWYEDEHIGCKYYKYDFENGARLIAETYLVPKSQYFAEHETCYLHLVGGPEPPKDKAGCYGKWKKHEKYNRFPNSETELVEFMKFAQRGK